MATERVPFTRNYDDDGNYNDDENYDDDGSEVITVRKSRMPKLSNRFITNSMILVILMAITIQRTLKVPPTNPTSNTHTKPPTQTTLENPQCMTFDEDLDKLLKSMEQIFIFGPAKSGGSSTKGFAALCSAFSSTKPTLTMNPGEQKPEIYLSPRNHEFMPDKFASNFGSEPSSDLLYHSEGNYAYQFPQILYAHVSNDVFLSKAIRSATDETLIIYTHRQETNRLVSAINYIGWKICARPDLFGRYQSRLTLRDNGECILEESVISEVITNDHTEINSKPLTSCSIFDGIEDNKPNMLFMNYKQIDQLVILLSKHYCPDLLKSGILPLRINMTANKDLTVYVKLEKDGTTHLLSDWVEKKKPSLPLTYDLNEKNHCYGRIRDIETKLFTCDDQLLNVSS